MMTRLLATLAVAFLLVGGCQNQKKQTEAAPTPAEESARVAQVRKIYQEVNQDIRVGYVNAILAEDQLVSVVDIPVADFKAGDTITFIDADQNPIANGRVVSVLEDAVHVHYTATVRPPTTGDIAIKFVR